MRVLVKPVCMTALVVWISAAAACAPVFSDSVRTQTQTIRVSSSPPGATVTWKDADSIRILGPTPVTATGRYQVVERRYNRSTCVLHTAAAGADAITDDDGDSTGVDALAGLFGFAVGAVTGTSACKEADGIVAVHPRTVMIEAVLPGHHPQQVSIQVPKDKPRVHFELVPADKPAPQPSPPAASAAASLPRLVVFVPVVSDGQLDPGLEQELAAHLAERIQDTGRFEVVPPGNQHRACRELACREKATADLSAGSFMDIRLMQSGELCLVSAILQDVITSRRRLITASSGTCDREALLAAMDKIAELLEYPAGAGL